MTHRDPSPHPDEPTGPDPGEVMPPMSVWLTGQHNARSQRTTRYVPDSTAHPGKMLPAIARRAITAYTAPGDVVLDPMCGIGTTLVEAAHLGRDAIGVEYEPRWAAVARRNIAHARRSGATGSGTVVHGDARQLGSLYGPDHHATIALVLTSPPYGRRCTDKSTPATAQVW